MEENQRPIDLTEEDRTTIEWIEEIVTELIGYIGDLPPSVARAMARAAAQDALTHATVAAGPRQRQGEDA